MRSGLVIALVALLATGASAEAGTARRATILTVVLNDVPAGEHIVYLDGNDVLVPADALRAAGFQVSATEESIEDVSYISLRTLPLTVEVDEDRMVLRLVAGAQELPSARFDLGRSLSPAGLQHGTAPSLYLNYGARITANDVSGQLESGLRVDRALAYSTVSIFSDHSIVRGLSRVTVDDRAGLRQLVLGDSMLSEGRLGGAAIVGGVHLVRSFDLDPYLSTAPAIDLSGSVLAPSTADVYVNGVLVRRERLAPGRYTFENLPITTGSSDTRIVIRDALGREQDVSRGFYTPATLLRPGLLDYHFALGAIREDVGLTSFDYGQPIAGATVRRGLTAHVTGGMRASVTPEQAGLGGTLFMGLPIGQLDVAFGLSLDGAQRGAAGSLSWGYSGRRMSFSLFAQRVSEQYATLDVPSEADRAISEGRLMGTISIVRGIALGGELAASDFRDRGWSQRASMRASGQLGGGAFVAISAGTSAGAQLSRSYDLLVSINVGLGGRTRASVSHRARADASDRTVAEIRHSLGTGSGVGYRATAELGETSRGTASVQAQTGVGRYELNYSYDATQGSTVDATIAGGVAVIGGRVFASPTIDRSFALVRVPGLTGVRARLENHVVGRTDSHGEVFIPNLQPYYGNNVSIDSGDLAFDRTMPTVTQVVAPPSGGGVIVTFAAPELHVIRGTIAVTRPGATPVVAVYGELVVGSGASAAGSPLGSDGQFELDGIPAGSQRGTVEWSGGRCELELVVPTSTEFITELGSVPCIPVPSKETP